MLAEGKIDQLLVVAAAGRVDLLTKRRQHVIVNADGDPGLADVLTLLHYFLLVPYGSPSITISRKGLRTVTPT